MTLIAGWKNKSAVFIAGDSAISGPGSFKKNSDLITSFGEAIVDESNRQVEDTALKVDVLGSKLIIASAGSDYKCRSFIKKLHKKINKSDTDIYSLIEETIEEFESTEDCAFIFGCVQQENPCFLTMIMRLISLN